jgi:16S rRNA U1498 N3-methylase RsmE
MGSTAATVVLWMLSWLLVPVRGWTGAAPLGTWRATRRRLGSTNILLLTRRNFPSDLDTCTRSCPAYQISRRFSSLSGDDHAARSREESRTGTELTFNNLQRLYVGDLPSEPVVIRQLSDLGSIPTRQQKPLSKDALVQLSNDQSHYVTSVLRLTKGSRRPPLVRLLDTSGDEWLAELLLLDNNPAAGKKRRRDTAPDTVTAVCRSKLRSLPPLEPSPMTYSCWLCVAPPKKKDRLKWMVEKTTELDCSGYIFLATDHSEAAVDKDSYKASKANNIISHSKLQAYTVEAAEQCERLTLPHFVTVYDEQSASSHTDRADDNNNHGSMLATDEAAVTTKLSDFLRVWSQQKDNGIKLLVCRERYSSRPLWNALEQIYATHTNGGATPVRTAVAFLIGPEGGWSPKEEEMMNELERDHPDTFFNVSLGPTVLRAETAATTVMAAFTLHRDYFRHKHQLR